MKVAVGLSGGVDSSVAAALLKDAGHEVSGVCMKIWDGRISPSSGGHACYGPEEEEDIEGARRVAQTLGIPFQVFDLSEEYREIVLGYFRAEYLEGRTPNPCLRCNPRMKFGKLLEAVEASGIEFDRFATGHYARVAHDPVKGRYVLKKAKDLTKDQSYGLVFLTQGQLSKALLPLGDISKKEVRQTARELGLETHDIPDSQDFFSGDYGELIGADANPGPIIDTGGDVVGRHDGLWRYTIGQRKGLGLSSEEPLYVKRIDAISNTLTVAGKDELYDTEMTAGDMNYISLDTLEGPTELDVKIRHTTQDSGATVTPLENNRIHVKFEKPQWAITPGQIAALYDGDTLVGGGVIEPLDS